MEKVPLFSPEGLVQRCEEQFRHVISGRWPRTLMNSHSRHRSSGGAIGSVCGQSGDPGPPDGCTEDRLCQRDLLDHVLQCLDRKVRAQAKHQL